MATMAEIESLRISLSYDRLPYCSGTVSPPSEGFYLYYGKEEPRFINFASHTPEQLDQLAAACSPATFGRGDQDVYDETYRKALKMDTVDFAAQFDPTVSSLTETIRENLLQGQAEKMEIKPEIYKLNIYGKDSFFKPHKDTPRGTDMFGSLVIVYPTAHQGGELLLRHKGREWKFEANALTSLRSSPSLAYVAFYSDIEHEVLKVTDGSRVTLTYNLYLISHDPIFRVTRPPEPSTIPVKPTPKSATNFKARLCQLLKSPKFMPKGGTLVFNLAHLYPVTFDTKLEDITAYLKGEDAHVYQSCQELGLEPVLRMIYTNLDDCSPFNSEPPSIGVMTGAITKPPDYHCELSSYQQALIEECGGVPVNLRNDVLTSDLEEYCDWGDDTPMNVDEQLTWVTDFTGSANELRDDGPTFGNQCSVDHIYSSPCLIVRIDPPGTGCRS